MMNHNEYFELFDRLIGAVDAGKIGPEHKDKYSNYHPSEYVREYRTVCLTLPRQCGKTTYIATRCRAGDIVISHNRMTADSVMKEHRIAVHTTDDLRNYGRGVSYRLRHVPFRIWVDEPLYQQKCADGDITESCCFIRSDRHNAGYNVMGQPDFFDPPHIAFLKEATMNEELAAPYQKKAYELRKLAYSLCPHDSIKTGLLYHEDEYGYGVSSWTEVTVKCEFCHKYGRMNRDEFVRSGLTYMDVLLGGYK